MLSLKDRKPEKAMLTYPSTRLLVNLFTNSANMYITHYNPQ